MRDAASVLITLAALYLCWVLARPFLALITWALALAVVAHPWHARLERRLRPGAATGLSVLIVALVLIAPAALQRSEKSTGNRIFSTRSMGVAFHRCEVQAACHGMVCVNDTR